MNAAPTPEALRAMSDEALLGAWSEMYQKWEAGEDRYHPEYGDVIGRRLAERRELLAAQPRIWSEKEYHDIPFKDSMFLLKKRFHITGAGLGDEAFSEEWDLETLVHYSDMAEDDEEWSECFGPIPQPPAPSKEKV